MRVAFLSAQAAFLDAVSRQQSALARIQEQVATGRKFTSASDDPVGATQSLTLDGVIATNERYVTNGTLATNRLQLEEGALTGVGDLLQRVRELTLQAANGPQSAEIRQLIAAEVRARLDELVATANTRDGNGEYLFAGTATATQPFVRNAGSVVYQGDQVQRLVQIGPDQYVADSDAGSSIFELLRNGNGVYAVAGEAGNTGTGRVAQRAVADATQYDQGSYRIQFTTADAWQVLDAGNAVIASGSYQAGDAIEFRGLSLTIEGAPAAGDQFNVTPSVNQSMFRTLENLLVTLERPDGTPGGRAVLTDELATALDDLDQAIGKVLETRAGIGARLSAIDSRTSQIEDTAVELKRALSGLRDTDYAEALTRLEQQLTTIEAAQKAFTRTQSLSLFDYL